MNIFTQITVCVSLMALTSISFASAHHRHTQHGPILAESGLRFSGKSIEQSKNQVTLPYRRSGIYKGIGAFTSANQTPTTSPIQPESALPFSVEIKQAPFKLPTGLQSGAFGVFKDYWVFIAGSLAGLHGFGNNPFPVSNQNTTFYVINSKTGQAYSRSIKDPSLGLTKKQIESLSVISPEFTQNSNTLYMIGGYGFDAEKQSYNTKPVFTAIDLQSIVDWVTQKHPGQLVPQGSIRQIYDPMFQVTGGELYRSGDLFLLIFGQNFDGEYTQSSNGSYTRQIRRFKINESNGQLVVNKLSSTPTQPNASYRRRDLNVLPVILYRNNRAQFGYVAYSGVFTLDGGIWTVPVIIDQQGVPKMAAPNLENTFKQGMNNYACAVANLYSKRLASNYNILFGGITYGFFAGGVFQTDAEIPFTKQVTTIQIDKNEHFTQYLMQSEYPNVSHANSNTQQANLLFGAGAYFIPSQVLKYANSVISLDNIRKPTVIGHIVGGIQSAASNVMFASTETAASAFVFEVRIIPK